MPEWARGWERSGGGGWRGGAGDPKRGGASVLGQDVGVLAARILPFLVLVELVVALFERGLGARAGRPGVVARLEGLEHAVAPVFVDRHLVGEADPLGALVGLHVEDLLVDRGGVVDDHDDLGLRVEVGAGLDQQLLDLVEVLLRIGGHRRGSYPPSSASWRVASASTSSGSSPCRRRRSLRAMTSWRPSARSASSWAAGAASAAAARSRADSASTSISGP